MSHVDENFADPLVPPRSNFSKSIHAEKTELQRPLLQTTKNKANPYIRLSMGPNFSPCEHVQLPAESLDIQRPSRRSKAHHSSEQGCRAPLNPLLLFGRILTHRPESQFRKKHYRVVLWWEILAVPIVNELL